MTKEERRIGRREKRLDEIVKSNRFLSNPNYYKNNYWSTAAWDSWAAQGKAGSCGCGCGYYNANLCNTRMTTFRGGRENSCKHVTEKLCYDCYTGIEKRLGVTFKRK